MTEQVSSHNQDILCLGAPRQEELIIQSFNKSQLPGEIRHVEALTISERTKYDKTTKWIDRASKAFFLAGSFWASKKLNSGELETRDGIGAVITAASGLLGLSISELRKYASAIAKRPKS